MSLSFFLCAACGKPAWQASGAVNRAVRSGSLLYCDRTCAGVARQKHKTAAQKKEEKRLYDQRRREELGDRLRAEKREYHKRTYDPAKAAAYRKTRMHLHVEYCRDPEYRAWKQQYDRRYNMERQYGPFWEAARTLVDLEREVRARASDYDIRTQNDTLNKSLKRKRAYAQISGDTSRQQQRAHGSQPQECAVGNAERHQGRSHAAGSR